MNNLFVKYVVFIGTCCFIYPFIAFVEMELNPFLWNCLATPDKRLLFVFWFMIFYVGCSIFWTVKIKNFLNKL